MAEYIERAAAVKVVLRERKPTNSVAQNYMLSIIQHDLWTMCAADVAPVVHGRWIHDGRRIERGIDWCHCSECGKSDNFCARTNYCPNCGAKMDGGADHEAD
nr:MAG TPA: zinc-ribbon containing domain protein [Caudoviricetes sp.]